MAPLLAPAQPPVPANERPSPIPPLAATAPRPPPEPPEGLSPERLEKIQAALRDEKLDGWLFYDFRGSDSIATRVLGLSTRGPRTRRWYCYVPARGTPQKLVHAIEPHSLDGVPGQVSTYASWRVRDRELGRILRGARRIAMQYSPRNEIPTVAKVDAGTLELVRAMGPEVVSSAGLVARIESVLTPEELATQARAAQIIAGVQEETAREAARRVREGHPATERELQEFASARMQAEGLVDGGPLIAVDEHAADPHSTATDGVAGHNSLLLLDFTGRVDAGPHAIQGDLTRVYFLGERIPDEIARVAQVVFEARDAALDLLRKRLEAHRPVTGAEVDEAARSVVARAGYADAFLHRTGHSIGLRAHGDGVNNDDFETRDTRKHLESTCFSIEPGIYLAHRFGIRSEVDACILQGGKLEVRGGEPQHEVPAMLAPEMPASLERSTHGP
jgi:Xaa-Pro aminopeptidase